MRPALTLAFFVAARILCAQSINASVSGRISDPSQALVVDAKIGAISSGTNSRYGTTTSAAGEYHLRNLPPDTYRLEVEKPGFKKLIKPDVILHVQDALAIDFELTLGETTETLTVEGGAPLVNSESGAVSTVIDRTFVESLPLNGRSFQPLIMLTPGAVVRPTTFDDQGQFSVNGQRADANYFTIDGVSANFGVTGYVAMVQTASGALPALSASGGTNSLVSVDAMQEFRIQTSSFAPEFGRMPGAQVSIVTRSGGNNFHGTVFEYFRNDALDAKGWFVNFGGLSKPAERLNDFGGVFGGPIRKDRTFFCFSYEGLRLRQPASQQTSVPDPASRGAAPASMQPYLNAFPVPNGPELGNGLAQFSASYSNPSTLNATSIRFDQMAHSKLTLFGRYNYSPSGLDQRGPPFSSGTVLSTTQSISSTVQTATIGATALITPRISNEFRGNYSNQRIGNRYAMDAFGGATPLSPSILFPPGYSPANAILQLLINGAGQYSLGVIGANEQRQINLIDNLSLTRSSHQVKFGVDYRWLAPFTDPSPYRQFAQFSGVTSAPGGALSGTALFAQAGVSRGNALLAQNFSLYGQDTWKIRPRLTLTFGLRWEVNPPLRGKNAANDPFTVTGLANPAIIALAPRGTPLYQTTYGNVAPRVGLAWQPNPRWGTTLRAGFGVFYDLGQGSLGGVTSYFPYLASKTPPSPTAFPLSPQDAAPPPFTESPPVSVIVTAVPNLALPRSYQWNAALEQSLGSDQSLTLAYVGAIGRDLLRVTQLINANSDFQFISLTDNSASSDYNALQSKFQRRLSHGLQVLASYTFAHSIDIASTDAFANYLNTPGSIDSPKVDRGNSDFDIRHAFTAGLTYDIPSPRFSNIASAVLGGWSLHGFVLARSAPPVNVVGAISFGAGTALASRPNLVSGVPLELYGSGYPGGKVFNRMAFSAVLPGQQGDLGRNVLRGFDAVQADIALQRGFRITEKTDVRLRIEFFNILNHPNFGNPNNSLSSPLFGRSTQTLANSLGSGGANGGLNPLYQIGGPRSIQLAVKLSF